MERRRLMAVGDVGSILDEYRNLAFEDAAGVAVMLERAREEPTRENCKRLKWKLELAAQTMARYLEKEQAAERLHPDYTPVVPIVGAAS
jgi:hypothetical protein